jgi:hypothetical protein
MSNSSSSAASSSSVASASNVDPRSTAQYILEWKEAVEQGGRRDAVLQVQQFLTSPDTESHVKQLSKEHAIEIMSRVLGCRFVTAELPNRKTRLVGLENAVRSLLEEDSNYNSNKEEDDLDEQEEENEVDEVVQDVEPTPSTPPPSDKAGVRPHKQGSATPTRARHDRKAKTVAVDRQAALALSDADLIKRFGDRIHKLKSGKRTQLKESGPTVKSKRVIKFESRVRPSTPDSSNDDSDTSDNSSDDDSQSSSSSLDSLSSDSESDSSSDSDATVYHVRSKHSKRLKRVQIRHQKRKRGSQLAKFMWSKSHGHVKRSLMKFEYKSKRNQIEALLLASVFDSLMKMNCNIQLYDKPIRLIASRITALQSYELTGSWEVADQFGEDSVHNGLVSRKQLNRAAKSAENIKKVMSKASSIATFGSKNTGGVTRDPSRPRVPPIVRNYTNNNQEQGPAANRSSGPAHQ